MLNITGFYHVNSSSAPFKDTRTAKQLPGTVFPDYLPLCIILLKFHCLFAQFWYTANKRLIWHLSTLFQMSHIQFHKFQIILNKMIPILSCYTAMQGISIFRALLQGHLLHYSCLNVSLQITENCLVVVLLSKAKMVFYSFTSQRWIWLFCTAITATTNSPWFWRLLLSGSQIFRFLAAKNVQSYWQLQLHFYRAKLCWHCCHVCLSVRHKPALYQNG